MGLLLNETLDGGWMDGLLDGLTFQVLFLGCSLFVRGGFAHRSAHIRPSQGVLRRGDAVRQRLPRHLLSAGSNLDCGASNMVLPPHTATEMSEGAQ